MEEVGVQQGRTMEQRSSNTQEDVLLNDKGA